MTGGEPFRLDPRVLVLATARAADAVGNSFLIVVLPLYIAAGEVTGGGFGLTEALLTGVVLSAFPLFNSVVQPFAGRLSDRTGRRRAFILLGLAVLTATNLAYSLVGDYASLIAVRLVGGLGVAFTVTASIALVNELSAQADRGGNFGVFNALRQVGFAAGPLAAGVVVEAGPYMAAGRRVGGFDAAFYVAALAAGVSLALVGLVVRDAEETAASAGDDLALSVRGEGRALDPVFTLGLATLFMAATIALLSTIQPQVNARLDQGPGLFGVEFAAFVATLVLAQFPVGRASDRFGRRPFVLAGMALLVPSTLAQGLVVTPAGMIAARAVQGVAAAGVFSPALALAGDLAREGESGTQLSVLTMAFGVGVGAGPLLSGFLVRYGYVVPFAFGAVLAAVGAALVYTQVEETLPDAGPAGEAGAAPTD